MVEMAVQLPAKGGGKGRFFLMRGYNIWHVSALLKDYMLYHED